MVGLGIDNVYVELLVLEVLIMDGSVGFFVFLLQFVGIKEQDVVKKFICIKKEVIVCEDDKVVIFKLFDGFKVMFLIEFDYLVFEECNQVVSIDFFFILFVKEVVWVWIFGFMCDIEFLCSQNLVLGGSVDNVIVVDEYCIFNEDGLCYDDEFVKYKMFDVIGDLYQFGYSLIGEFVGYKFGYVFNNVFLCELFKQEDVWELVIFEDVENVLIFYVKLVMVVE